MYQEFKRITVVGRKEYHDDGSENILNCDIGRGDFDEADKLIYDKFVARKWRIPKGEKHKYIVGVFESDFFALRVSLDAEYLIQKYEI